MVSLTSQRELRLGVNIDHVATIRNARGTIYPDPLRAAFLAQKAGADGITAHLREDRRHIRDDDLAALSRELTIPLNFEMAATPEMLETALMHHPHACCIVPEKRAELTTEGGLDVIGGQKELEHYVKSLKESGARVSLFVDPGEDQIRAAHHVGADIIELHTGTYCELILAGDSASAEAELTRVTLAAALGEKLGLEVHAGHGLTYDTVMPIAAIAQIRELNIGHFIIGEAIFDGLAHVVKQMRALMDQALAGN